jgi:hypothetical protein
MIRATRDVSADLFRYSELRSFLSEASKYGKVESFQNMTDSHGVILRHDVDFDIEPAFRLALLEKECNVRSTFFFLTSCPAYNVNSSENRRMLKTIADNGFEIGLHFDPTIYSHTAPDDLEQKAIFEASILEFIVGTKIMSVSIHNPSLHGQYPQFRNFRNAYDPEYFQPDNYLSDSRMTFRDKSPYTFLQRARTTRLQILLHPIHYSETGENYRGLVRNCVYRFSDDLHNYVKANSQYAEDMEGQSLRDIL